MLRHQDIRGRRAKNVGERLLQAEEYRTWCAGSGGDESNNAILFCYCDPGAGQTVLGKKDEAREIKRKGQVLTSRDASSLVIDNLCYHARGQNVAVACVFFNFAPKEQFLTNILGTLLNQVVGELEGAPGEISQAYET